MTQSPIDSRLNLYIEIVQKFANQYDIKELEEKAKKFSDNFKKIIPEYHKHICVISNYANEQRIDEKSDENKNELSDLVINSIKEFDDTLYNIINDFLNLQLQYHKEIKKLHKNN